jgi:16S rRNA C967 or C1407 C5-methylase (RsmB/RsmF family)/NOL1/NOP2/fmu family ribosome biogenesis protein
MERLLGGEAEAFFAALSNPPSGLRVNTLRITPERFRRIAPFQLQPAPYPPESFLVGEEARAGAHPYHAAGLYYLQDPGAMVVGALPELPLAPRVLDLAAAPGGKATHLAARMAGEGILVANDVHAGRARELAGNLERFGARNAIVTSEAPERLAELWDGWFDLVVVDAPCSGESMFHKSEAAVREWSPVAVRGCARRQGELLRDAVRLVRPGGVLLYSTCTFAPEEDEEVLARLLREVPDVEMAPLPPVEGAEAARPEWAGETADPAIARALRLWPHRFPGAGHFVAALRRTGGEESRLPGAEDLPAPSGAARALFEEFAAANLAVDPVADARIVAAGEELYALPVDTPPLAHVRALRPGWWLGSARKGRFEPSHSLAMGITPPEAARSLSYPADAPEIAAFLRGESLRVDGENGWALVCVEGFPLGWGKRTGATVKNHYPRGLRRH